jgi:hypothetical protein
MNRLQKFSHNRFITANIKKINKEKFLPLFTSEKNNKIIDELNRNMRVIEISLRDHFGDNIMNRGLEQIVKEYFLLI